MFKLKSCLDQTGKYPGIKLQLHVFHSDFCIYFWIHAWVCGFKSVQYIYGFPNLCRVIFNLLASHQVAAVQMNHYEWCGGFKILSLFSFTIPCSIFNNQIPTHIGLLDSGMGLRLRAEFSWAELMPNGVTLCSIVLCNLHNFHKKPPVT